MGKNISKVGVEDLVLAGLIVKEAKEFDEILKETVRRSKGLEPREVWRELVAQKMLKPWHPHGLHQLVYYSVYNGWDASSNGPPLYWFPSIYQSRLTNLGRVMEVHGPKLLGTLYKDPIKSFSLFQKFTVQHPEVYWSIVLKELSVEFQEAPKCILDRTENSKPGGVWLESSVLNIAECCVLPSNHPRREDDSVAVVWRDEGCDDSPVNRMTLKELREQVMLVANALDATFSKGDAIAIDMPMTVYAVIIYLAIILAGCVVVSIADSFAAREIAIRLRVSNAKGIFTQGRADDTMNLGGIKKSSIEIERVCDRADESILETAAISVAQIDGGPEVLVVFVVLKTGFKCQLDKLKMTFTKAIQSNLNPLFKVSFVKILPEFPRTASNKLLRRVLRDQAKLELSVKSRI